MTVLSIPRIVYVTEKGCDLLDLFPDIRFMERAMRNGVSWFDLELYNMNNIKPQPFTVVKTTEAELVQIRQRERSQIVHAECMRIFDTLKNLPQEERIQTRLVDHIANACFPLPQDIRYDVGDSLCVQMYEAGLIYAPPAEPAAPTTPPRRTAPKTPDAPQKAKKTNVPVSRHKRHLQWIMDSLAKQPPTSLLTTIIKPLRIPTLKREWLLVAN